MIEEWNTVTLTVTLQVRSYWVAEDIPSLVAETINRRDSFCVQKIEGCGTSWTPEDD